MVLSDSNFQLTTFAELSNSDLYQILQLRSAVFVLEQDCAYQDLDDFDLKALHLYRTDDSGKSIIAYARILTPEQCNDNHSCIGRVVVQQDQRHDNIGQDLMQAAIQASLKKFPNHPIKISAQSYWSHFYQQLGFINTGHFYLEDQIPHQEMLYQPK